MDELVRLSEAELKVLVLGLSRVKYDEHTDMGLTPAGVVQAKDKLLAALGRLQAWKAAYDE